MYNAPLCNFFTLLSIDFQLFIFGIWNDNSRLQKFDNFRQKLVS